MLSLNVPVVGILRGIGKNQFGQLMSASFDAGLEAIEITMNTKGAPDIVETYRNDIPKNCWLGMGTIRNLSEAQIAYNAGAMFFVTPNTDIRVIEFAKKKEIPIIVGALTPTEVYQAWSAGADMIKVFPAGNFGPSYIKDLLGPFDTIPLVAVGGVTGQNVSQYLKAGAKAVGVGSSLFGEKALKEGDFRDVSSQVKKFIKQCQPL